jgi:hypothetical protein
MSTMPPDGATEPNAHSATSAPSYSHPSTGETAPPAGWYPTPTGEQQFWDGQKWLALPEPSPAATAPDAATTTSKNRGRAKWLLIAGAAVLLVGLIAGGIAWKVKTDARAAEVAAQAAAEKSAAEEREEQERDAARAAAAKEAREDAERDSRRESVTEIESSVEEMAKDHAADGIIDGPIIDVSCSPVGGGSTDDLTEQTTVFECFVANEDNGDGTMSGFTYNATMNWSTGSFTYGLGAP